VTSTEAFAVELAPEDVQSKCSGGYNVISYPYALSAPGSKVRKPRTRRRCSGLALDAAVVGDQRAWRDTKTTSETDQRL
jgi:hypothetical protein